MSFNKWVFQQILGELFAREKLATPEACAEFLRNLRDPAKALWHAYQDGQKVDYADRPTQDAFLLRYYPFSVPLIYDLLSELPGNWTPNTYIPRNGCGHIG
jgi:hypothetical protein